MRKASCCSHPLIRPPSFQWELLTDHLTLTPALHIKCFSVSFLELSAFQSTLPFPTCSVWIPCLQPSALTDLTLLLRFLLAIHPPPPLPTTQSCAGARTATPHLVSRDNHPPALQPSPPSAGRACPNSHHPVPENLGTVHTPFPHPKLPARLLTPSPHRGSHSNLRSSRRTRIKDKALSFIFLKGKQSSYPISHAITATPVTLGRSQFWIPRSG